VSAIFACLRAMALVHQHKDVGIHVRVLRRAQRRIELVHDGGKTAFRSGVTKLSTCLLLSDAGEGKVGHNLGTNVFPVL
jgi:hypothetical protein